MNRREMLKLGMAGVAGMTLAARARAQAAPGKQDRPNILWIIVEDMSAHFSCYGTRQVDTPNVDKMAAEGVLFEKAFVTCPVCSPARSALVSGMCQTSIGAHCHRSGRGELKIELPDKVTLVPRLFQQAGYYTSNGNWQNGGVTNQGKTDYNFEYDPDIYDGMDWTGRAEGQPFFAQIQLQGGKLRDVERWYEEVREAVDDLATAEEAILPPYYPEHPAILEDWARYLNSVKYTDQQVGEIIEHLRQEDLLKSTVVFFMTDHGISHARGKQFLYDEGTHVPLVARGPGLPAGKRRADLVAHIDLAAASLGLAGIDVPDWMEARDILAKDYTPRDYVVSARDRCDETVDSIRSVRTDRFKYIRNRYPQRPYLSPNRYKDHKPTLIAIREWEQAGKLNEVQQLVVAKERAPEELYDLARDPWEIRNLADEPVYQADLERLRNTLDEWVERTGDAGRVPESEAMYDSDMAVYLQGLERNDPEGAAQLKENIDTMKRWAAEGK